MDRKRLNLLLCAGLALLALAAFWPALGNGFVNYDDNLYVTDNPRVQAGLGWGGLVWAFTTGHSANWHPLTWLSHQLDCALYGLDPRGHHLTSVLLHLANAVLFFLLLERFTGRAWPAALAAALFALHPLRVESVAWVAERKDVLSALFWLLATQAYVSWTRRPGRARYAAVILLLGLGLMAKPMLVTLPFVLLLLDWWPLGRLDPARTGAWRRLGRLVLEKAPLFVLAAASALVTLLVQQAGGAVQSAGRFSFSARLSNALHAYTGYLAKTLWPADLAVYYPYPAGGPAASSLLHALLLLGLAAALLLRARRRPAPAVGWLWFLGTLVPVIGLVQVGGQAMADRYTYIPSLGLCIALVFGAADLPRPWRRLAAAACALALLLPLVLLTRRQAGHWRDSFSLFEHALAATEGNNLAHNNLGAALADQGRREEAIAHFRAALAIHPDYPSARLNLAKNLLELGRTVEAEQDYRAVLRLRPDDPTALLNLGALLGRQGRTAEARRLLEAALASRPECPEAHNNLGIVLAMEGDLAGAIRHFARAVDLKPDYRNALQNLAAAYRRQGRPEEARRVEQRLR